MSAHFQRLGFLVCKLAICTLTVAATANAQDIPVYQFERGTGTPSAAAFPGHRFGPSDSRGNTAATRPSQSNASTQTTSPQANTFAPHAFTAPRSNTTGATSSAATATPSSRSAQFQTLPGRSATYQNAPVQPQATRKLDLTSIYGASAGNPFLTVPLNKTDREAGPQDIATPTATGNLSAGQPKALNGGLRYLQPNYGQTAPPTTTHIHPPTEQIAQPPAEQQYHQSATPLYQQQGTRFSNNRTAQQPFLDNPQPSHTQEPPLEDCADSGCGAGDSVTGACGIGGCKDDSYVLPRLGSGRDNGGWFFSYDLLYWTVSNPSASVIGDAASEGLFTRGGITLDLRNSLDTSFIDYQFHSGHRFEFGNSDGCNGWLANVSFGDQAQALETTGVSFIPTDGTFPNQYLAGWIDANGDGIDDDLDSDNFFGRFGEDEGTPDGLGGFTPPFDGIPDTAAPTDYDDLRYFPALFDTFTATNSVTITNFELMRLHRASRNFEWQYGVRYFDFKERFALDGVGGSLDEMHTVTKFDNQIIGVQVGGRYVISRPVGTLAIEGRFTAGANMQDARLNGTLATNSVLGASNAPVNLEPQSFNHRLSDQEFVPMGELRITYTFPVSCNGAFRFGYTGIVAGGIGRASEVMVYELPALNLNGANNTSTVVVNAITAGFEFRR